MPHLGEPLLTGRNVIGPFISHITESNSASAPPCKGDEKRAGQGLTSGIALPLSTCECLGVPLACYAMVMRGEGERGQILTDGGRTSIAGGFTR